MSSAAQTPVAPSAPAPKLTGGIEIECLLLTDIRPGTASHARQDAMHNHNARMRIYEAFSTPLPVVCVDCRRTHLYRLPLHEPRSSTLRDEVDEEDMWHGDRSRYYSKWNVSIDESVVLTDIERTNFSDDLRNMHVAPIEIKSRVLDLTETFNTSTSTSDPNHIHKITHREEIRAVYSRLNESFNSPNGMAAKEHRIVVNRSGSSHVHIGNGRNGFTLGTVKNIVSIVVAHEMHFDSIHAAGRITGSDLLSRDSSLSSGDAFSFMNRIASAYNVPWSTALIMSAFDICAADEDTSALPDRANKLTRNPELNLIAQKFDVASWLSLIESAETLADLCQLESGPATTVRLRNLQGEPNLSNSSDGCKLTIEFRQKAGTQTDEILNWIQVLVSLFQYADTTAAVDVKAMCMSTWNDPNFNVFDLLRKLGHRAEDDVFRHYAHVLGSIPTRKPYAEVIESKELEEAGKFSADDLFAPLMKHLIRDRAKTIHPDTVRDLISAKLTCGGYGQFSESYLNGKSERLTGAQRKYLTLGFVPSPMI